MTRRVVLEIVLTIGIAIAIAWLIVGVLALADSADPLGTLVDQTPRVLFGLLGIGIGVWAILVTIGAIVLRRRAPGVRVASHLVSLVIALVINVALLALVTIATSGGGADSWGMLVVAIAGVAGVALLIAGIAAVLLVNLAILRPKPAKTGVNESGESAV